MGIDLTEYSPAVQRKIVYAGVVASSHALASEMLKGLAELGVPAKQVERLTRLAGTQRVAERDALTDAFRALPLAEKFVAPDGVDPPGLAVVMVDGGRLQIRERTPAADMEDTTDAEGWEEERPAKGHWREDKIGLLLGMKSETHAADPCPAIPDCFLDAARIPVLAREIGKVAAASAAADAPAAADASAAADAPETLRHEPPEVLHRRMAASCRPWPAFAVDVARAAWAAGFQGAARKAFVADGAANNWRLRARFFGSFVPVLDFIHALAYVYAAAAAGRAAAEGWAAYREWIGWAWEGEVGKVIEALGLRQGEVGLPEEGESETSVKSVVARTLGYLRNHQDKMKYHEYRKEGLPMTSSLMESAVKEMNRRVKGTEKFWCGQGAEAIVQMRADHLSDDGPLDGFWERRQANATGQRPYRRAA